MGLGLNFGAGFVASLTGLGGSGLDVAFVQLGRFEWLVVARSVLAATLGAVRVEGCAGLVS